MQILGRYNFLHLSCNKRNIIDLFILSFIIKWGIEEELFVSRLAGKGVYVFEEIYGFQLPVLLETFTPTMERLIASIMLLDVMMMLKHCIGDETVVIQQIVWCY